MYKHKERQFRAIISIEKREVGYNTEYNRNDAAATLHLCSLAACQQNFNSQFPARLLESFYTEANVPPYPFIQKTWFLIILYKRLYILFYPVLMFVKRACKWLMITHILRIVITFHKASAYLLRYLHVITAMLVAN